MDIIFEAYEGLTASVTAAHAHHAFALPVSETIVTGQRARAATINAGTTSTATVQAVRL
jgi:hypothetical protein